MDFSLLSVVQSAAADTVVALQVRDTIAQASDIAILVAAAAITFMALYLAWSVAKVRGVLQELRRAVHQNLGPASDRARSISENVQFITQAVRTDVERLNASVKALTARLHQASDRMEERIEEFNALMEVVQGEAEDIFLDTAATVRGVRQGASSIAAEGSASDGDTEGAGGDADLPPDAPGADSDAAETEHAKATTKEN